MNLDTRLGLNTSSETKRGHFEDILYSTEVIYSSSDQDYDSRDRKTGEFLFEAQRVFGDMLTSLDTLDCSQSAYNVS